MLVDPTAAALRASLRFFGASIEKRSKRGLSMAAITRPVWLAEFLRSFACSHSARWNCQYMISGTESRIRARATSLTEKDRNRR